jgi:glycosyltransferase 2 family protein
VAGWRGPHNAGDFSVTLTSTNSSGRRAIFGIVLRIAGTIVVLALLFHFLPVRQVGAVLRLVPVHLWLLVVVGYLACHVVASLKWRMIVNGAGSGLSVPQAAQCYFAGLFSVLVLPSIVGGDIVKAGLAMRMGRSKAAILFGSFLDRILDFLALALLTAAGAVLVPGSLSAESRRVFFVLGAAVLGLGIVAAAVILLLPARRFSFRMRRRLARLREAQRAMAERPQFVLAALMLALLVQSSFIALTAILANAAGLHLAFQDWLFAWPMAKISALVPLTQGGIGVREAALVGLLLPFGAPAARTVAVGFAWEGVIIAGGLIGGLGAFLIGRLRLDRG